MAASKKKVVSKEDLRRLMKQTKSDIKRKGKRVDHLLAKYNTLDRLVCTLCNCEIKNDQLWNAHLQSRQHKYLVTQKQQASFPEAPSSLKRPSSPTAQTTPNKKLKDANGISKQSLPTELDSSSKDNVVTSKPSLLADYESSSDEDEEEEQMETDTKPLPNKSSTGLPGDFFDSTSEEVKEEKPKVMSEKLPEGFFDDPHMDAKVRQVEYKDKMEEEWERFQSAMKEENKESEVIREEEDMKINVERNLHEIDSQMNSWQEIDTLHDKLEVVEQQKNENNSDLSDDDLDISEIELFNWRAKKS